MQTKKVKKVKKLNRPSRGLKGRKLFKISKKMPSQQKTTHSSTDDDALTLSEIEVVEQSETDFQEGRYTEFSNVTQLMNAIQND